jgi:TorA maturation chaperone TorD
MSAAVQPHALSLLYPIGAEDAARADFYALLARLFYGAPDAALLAWIAAADEIVAEQDDAPLAQAWSALIAACAAVEPDAVRQEYDDLFVGVGRPEVMLFGSFYLAGFMNEKPLVRLRDDLVRLGLARRSGATEPEDHVAALADVMRHLIGDTAATPAQREACAQAFFAEHLEPWYPKLCAAIEAAPQANFYRRAAAFARAFLDIESQSFHIEA